MDDLVLGFAVSVTASLAAFLLGRAVGVRVGQRTSNLLALISFVGLLAYLAFIWDQAVLVRWLPFSNAVVLGNWLPLEAAFVGGLAVTTRTTGVRRWLPVIALQLAAMVTVIWPLLGATPRCGDSWYDSTTCLQTTNKTCSAAAAATLLKLHGIPATEQEMAELCLTRNGTNWLGVYRGLKRKTAGTAWDVEVFNDSAEEVCQRPRPAILFVGLEHNRPHGSQLQTEFGWRPGMQHSVVLLRSYPGNLLEIAEPSELGRDYWTTTDFKQLYRGQGLRLVRNPSAQTHRAFEVASRTAPPR